MMYAFMDINSTIAACADTNPQQRFLVYPGNERFPLDETTDAISVIELAGALQKCLDPFAGTSARGISLCLDSDK
jgi:hypothetical protein